MYKKNPIKDKKIIFKLMIRCLISFVVPVYNAKNTLKCCVDSILAQSYRNIEIILIDDGSDDGSAQECDCLAQEESRIKIIHQSNQGVSAARNKGIESAKGDYITFVDADDWIDKNVCQKFVDVLQKKDYDLFCYSAIYSNSKNSKKSFLFGSDIDLLSNQQREELLCKTMTPWAPWFEYNSNTRFAGSSCGKFYKTSLLKEHKLYFLSNVKISEDVLFNVIAFDYLKKIGYTRQSFYHYEMRADSAQNRYRPNSWTDFCQIIDSIQRWLDFAERSQNIKESATTLFIHYLFGTLKEDLFHRNNPNKKNSYDDLKKLLEKNRVCQILNMRNKSYFSFLENVLTFLLKKRCYTLIRFVMYGYNKIA